MAISFSPEQFERLLAEMLSRVTPVARGEGGEGHQRRRILTDKGFSRVGKFSHGEGSWGEWSFDFKTALGAQSVELKAYLQGIERQTEVIKYARAVAMDEERAEKVNLEKLSAELYEMLVMMTEGEAKLIVKACIAGDGLEAWSRLQKHYSKRTVARLLRLHREVMYPKQAELGQLVTAIMEWEDKWRRMEVEMNVKDKIPEIWKMGAFLELCPVEVQNLIFQNLNEIGEDYGALMQKVVSFVSNKVASNSSQGPVPMDVGGVRREAQEEEGHLDIDAVNKSFQCFKCWGWGHSQRECPTKGGKGDGKGQGGGKGGKGDRKSVV